MKLKPYSKYKDSEIEWIGEIPEEWDNYKLKHVVNEFVAGGTPRSDDEKFWAHDEHGIPWVNIGDMTNKEIVTETKKEITVEGQADKGLRVLKNGTLLYSIFASLGKVAVLGIDATTNQAILGLIISKKIDTTFLKYYLKNLEETIITLSNANTQNNLNSTIVKNIEIAIPSLPDQTAIANFLDRKIAKGNALIEKDKKLIALLKEKRTALINHAVTKGLDPNVKLKDSGVEWIGKIPDKWSVRRIDKLSTVSRGASPRPIDDPKYFDDGEEYSWVRIADVTASGRYLLETTEKLSTLGKSLSVPLEPGRLFISIAGTVGKPIITKIKCCIHDGFVYFKNLKVLNEYLYYIFIGGQAYLGLGKLGTQLNLNTETIGLITIPLPPKEEQEKIVEYLDKANSKMDKTIQKIEKKIELLEEYKKSLIHHVVTGKVDVRKSEV